MAKCDHSRKIILLSSGTIYLRCILCGEVISVEEIIRENIELKDLNNKYEVENSEINSWIREIENKNDELRKENVALKNCLKAVIK